MLEIFWLLPLATLFQEGECSKKRERRKKEKYEEIKGASARNLEENKK